MLGRKRQRELLSIYHEVVIAQVSTDDNIQAVDELGQDFVVEYIAFDDFESKGLVVSAVQFRSIAAETSKLMSGFWSKLSRTRLLNLPVSPAMPTLVILRSAIAI